MNKNITPIFTSHYSLGKSTLTLDKPEYLVENKPILIDKPEDINNNSPISILSIAKAYKLNEIYLIENNFSGFIEAYKNAKKIGVSLIFGLKVVICDNIENKSEESFKSESKIIIWMKNSNAYKDLIRIYSKAATDGFYYIPRIDWKTLKSLWTENLSLFIPPYSSFLHQNVLKGKLCIPDFGAIKPTILFARMSLPFDDILINAHSFYAKSNNFSLEECHPVYFYSDKQFDSYLCFKAIHKRETMSKPNLDHHGSREFCFESYLRK